MVILAAHVNGTTIQIPLPKAVRPIIAVNNELPAAINSIVVKLNIILMKKNITNVVRKDNQHIKKPIPKCISVSTLVLAKDKIRIVIEAFKIYIHVIIKKEKTNFKFKSLK
nr:hypothetical protein [Macrococcus epidermidis]